MLTRPPPAGRDRTVSRRRRTGGFRKIAMFADPPGPPGDDKGLLRSDQMNLTYSEEQIMLKESVERFVADAYVGRDKAPDFDPAIWKRFADLGWLSLLAPETAGGLGAGAVESGIVMEAFGRGLVSEPFMTSVVLCGDLIASLGSPAQQQDLLGRLGAGRLKLGFAHEESRRFAALPVACKATRAGEGWRLDGAKTFALDAAEADILLVVARVAGDAASREGLGVFLAPRDAAGLRIDAFARLGGGSAARLALEGVELPAGARLGGEAADALDRAHDKATAALSCEALGVMQAVLEKTVEYAKTRVQFDRPLAANQVVRHRLADMAIACEEARSLSLRACLLADADAATRMRAVSGAKAKIGRHARFVAEQAVQLHGGMGVTEELDIGRYLKRVVAYEALFGDSAFHLARRAGADKLVA